jgi:hypothetical protein
MEINPPIKSRDMVPSEVREFLLGQRIWERWKINFGTKSVLIEGGKFSLAVRKMSNNTKTRSYKKDIGSNVIILTQYYSLDK